MFALSESKKGNGVIASVYLQEATAALGWTSARRS